MFICYIGGTELYQNGAACLNQTMDQTYNHNNTGKWAGGNE